MTSRDVKRRLAASSRGGGRHEPGQAASSAPVRHAIYYNDPDLVD